MTKPIDEVVYTSNITNKVSILRKSDDRALFIQKYPKKTPQFLFQRLSDISKLSPYATNILYTDSKCNEVGYSFISGSNLSSIECNEFMLSNILSKHEHNELCGFKSLVMNQLDEIRELSINNISSKSYSLIFSSTYWRNIHGDLHPDNIIIDNDGNFHIIDWDLSGEGYVWFDYLCLLTHPYLSINKTSMLEIFSNLMNNIEILDLEKIIHIFIKVKIKHLKRIAINDKEINNIILLYGKG
jgi:serine/threonine protein kinase